MYVRLIDSRIIIQLPAVSRRGDIGNNNSMVCSQGKRSPSPPVPVKKESGRVGFELGGIQGRVGRRKMKRTPYGGSPGSLFL